MEPLDLMAWLATLVTPRRGMGSKGQGIDQAGEPDKPSTPRHGALGRQEYDHGRAEPSTMSEPTFDPESTARVLEAHPDYRVLRRLEVRDDFEMALQRPPGVAVVVDTETTCTDSRADHIIELALVRFEYCLASGAVSRVTRVYSELEDPGEPIPPESTAIHGITDEMVQGRRIDDAQVAQLLDGAAVVIAHNAAFDRPFLERRLPVFAQQHWACSHAQVPWAEEGFSGSKLEYLGVSWGSSSRGTAARSTAARCSRCCVARCRNAAARR